MKTYTVKIDKHGTKRYYNENGERHREDGPAVEWVYGDKAWYKHGHLHREDGPAIEYINGDKSWYLNGTEYSEETFNKKMIKITEYTMAEINKHFGCKVKIIESH